MLDVSFAYPQQLLDSSTYSNPSITVNGNNNSLMLFNNSVPNIYYAAGPVKGCCCQFGKPTLFGSNGTIGTLPVAGLDNNNNCMLAYAYQPTEGGSNVIIESSKLANGALSDPTNWQQITNAVTPTIAVNNNGFFVEVHQNTSNNYLYYVVGTITNEGNNNPAITYANVTSPTSVNYGENSYFKGACPTVSINDNNELVLTFVWANNAFMMTGTISATGITFHGISQLGFKNSSEVPRLTSVTLANDGTVILVVTIEAKGQNSFWKSIGTLSKGQISWNSSQQALDIENVSAFSVATAYDQSAQANIVFLAQQQQPRQVKGPGGVSYAIPAGIYFTGSYLIDRSKWMSKSLSRLGNQPLRNIVMPGSHDAGMYTAQNCTPVVDSAGRTVTQTNDFTGQLNAGIRYFDIRPLYVLSSNSFVTYHKTAHLGCEGGNLTDILNQVAKFVSQNNELVILKISHEDLGLAVESIPGGPLAAENTIYTHLVETVNAILQPYYVKNITTPIANLKLNSLISANAQHGVVLPVFSGIPSRVAKKYKGMGIYTYGDYGSDKKTKANMIVYDVYTGTTDLQNMISDQFGKLTTSADHPQNGLFLLSWTLTYVNPVLKGAWQANQALWPNIVSEQPKMKTSAGTFTPNILYIDACEGFVTDVAAWLNGVL